MFNQIRGKRKSWQLLSDVAEETLSGVQPVCLIVSASWEARCAFKADQNSDKNSRLGPI